MNIKAVIITLAILLLLLLIAIILMSKPSQPGLKQPQPTTYQQVTPIPSPSLYPLPGSNYNAVNQTDQQFIDEQNKVGQLLDKLPFKGANFSITYKISTNQFLVIINKDNQIQGNRELDKFLQDNDISSRTWLRNLVINNE